MSRLSGNFGATEIKQPTNTQATANAGGFKGFMMAIGKGLSRAGQAIAHFFGTSVPNFFKSLGQRNATQITTNDQPRSMTLGDEEKSEGSSLSTTIPQSEMKFRGDVAAHTKSTIVESKSEEKTTPTTSSKSEVKTKPETKVSSSKTGGDVKTSGSAFSKSVSLTDIKWSTAKNFDIKDSGHGGVVICDVGGAKAVIKGGGGGSANEILGARLARELGLPAPETRLLTNDEKSAIAQQMRQQGATMPKRGGDDGATIVMEFVEGKTLGENTATKQEVKQLAQSLGKWLAFDAVISEQDRFGSIQPNSIGSGINTANFLVNPKNPGEIIGIDQNVMTVDTTKAMNSIMRGDDFFFMGVGQALANKFPGLGLDFEALGDEIKTSSQQMFKQIGTTLTDTKLAQLSAGLGMEDKFFDALSERCGIAHDYSMT